jgi:hypothetical protein
VRDRRPRTGDQVGDQENAGAGGSLAPLRGLVNVLGPTTLLTALLAYFGYVGTRARFEYFGVYLTMVDLSTPDLLLLGLEVIYVPALVISLGILVVGGAHAVVSWLLTSKARELAWSAAGLIAVVGLLLIGRAVVGILVPGVVETEMPPGRTPLALALGPILVGYSIWIAVRIRIARESESAEPGTFTHWYTTPAVRILRQAGVVSVLGIFIVGLFWASNSFALAFGAGRAYQDALVLRKKPEVIIEVRERLQDVPPGVTEINLGGASDEDFRYRYRNLRLLIESGDRLFLVPAHWTRAGRTIIVSYDSNVRIQLIPAPTMYEPPS